MAAERGFDAVAYGAIVDDLGDHRPGMDAARSLGILAPLLDAGMGKNEVRHWQMSLIYIFMISLQAHALHLVYLWVRK